MTASRAAVVVVGDALLDRDLTGTVERVCPDAPAPVVDVDDESARPGGAALAALLAARDGADVTLVTALGRDGAGARVRSLLQSAGVRVVDLGLHGSTPEKIRVRAGGTSIARVDRGGAGAAVGPCPPGAADRLAAADAVLVADYGRGITAHRRLRGLLEAVAARVPLVWDPHPNGSPPVAATQVVTPNERELAHFTTAGGTDLAGLDRRACELAVAWRIPAAAVTLGSRGALVGRPGSPPLVVPAPAVAAGDTCGAGDAFAAAATVAFARGAVLSEAVEAAVAAAAAFVGRGAAAGMTARTLLDVVPDGGDAATVVERVRARGGTVVAAGGCFDLLHAGHVAMLRAARMLGDCLVVLCNSDDSVRRLKGPGRPLQRADDRAAVLRALDCVDAVEVFDTDTPIPSLRRLRPDVFAKGGDYALGDLPEVDALAAWGGQVVVLPYIAGHSTTRLLQEAAHRVR